MGKLEYKLRMSLFEKHSACIGYLYVVYVAVELMYLIRNFLKNIQIYIDLNMLTAFYIFDL